MRVEPVGVCEVVCPESDAGGGWFMGGPPLGGVIPTGGMPTVVVWALALLGAWTAAGLAASVPSKAAIRHSMQFVKNFDSC